MTKYSENVKALRGLGDNRFNVMVLNYSEGPDQALYVILQVPIVGCPYLNDEILWDLLRSKSAFLCTFLALSFIQLLALQEATVLRLVWMVESTSEYSIRAMRYSSCRSLPKLILDQVLFPGECRHLLGASHRNQATQLNTLSAVRQKAYNPQY